MKSFDERSFINGKKYTRAEREAHELSIAFLACKYKVANSFFRIIVKFKLFDPQRLRSKFLGSWAGYSYFADKLTQKHTFGRYDPMRPQRGGSYFDHNSVISDIPTWFTKPIKNE